MRSRGMLKNSSLIQNMEVISQHDSTGCCLQLMSQMVDCISNVTRPKRHIMEFWRMVAFIYSGTFNCMGAAYEAYIFKMLMHFS